MSAIAATTGGRSYPLDNPAAAFDQTTAGVAAVQIYRPIWFWFAIVALAAFLLELMTRSKAGIASTPYGGADC